MKRSKHKFRAKVRETGFIVDEPRRDRVPIMRKLENIEAIAEIVLVRSHQHTYHRLGSQEPNLD